MGASPVHGYRFTEGFRLKAFGKKRVRFTTATEWGCGVSEFGAALVRQGRRCTLGDGLALLLPDDAEHIHDHTAQVAGYATPHCGNEMFKPARRYARGRGRVGVGWRGYALMTIEPKMLKGDGNRRKLLAESAAQPARPRKLCRNARTHRLRKGESVARVGQ
jgi:hypothetical protein